MRLKHQLRFLTIYSAVVTAAFALTVYFGTTRHVIGASDATEFDRIRAHRIDIVEPDGTPRLSISNRGAFPGTVYHGHETPRHDRNDSAGLLFFNDEGTEDGGLIYGGKKVGAAPTSFSHLSFDQYDQDQTIDIGTSLTDSGKASGIVLNDAPAFPITPDLAAEADRIKAMPHGKARAEAWADLTRRFPGLTERASMMRALDGSVGIRLRDQQGRSRLELEVTAAGDPQIRLLNPQGKVEKQLTLAAIPFEPPASRK